MDRFDWLIPPPGGKVLIITMGQGLYATDVLLHPRTIWWNPWMAIEKTKEGIVPVNAKKIIFHANFHLVYRWELTSRVLSNGFGKKDIAVLTHEEIQEFVRNMPRGRDANAFHLRLIPYNLRKVRILLVGYEAMEFGLSLLMHPRVLFWKRSRLKHEMSLPRGVQIVFVNELLDPVCLDWIRTRAEGVMLPENIKITSATTAVAGWIREFLDQTGGDG